MFFFPDIFAKPGDAEKNANDTPDELLMKLMNGPVRDALNISKTIEWGGQMHITFHKLSTDFMKPATTAGEFGMLRFEMDSIPIRCRL